MEFIARKVTHPNGKISREQAEEQLKAHPQFKPGTVIVGMDQVNGRWVARLHEPKEAQTKEAAPPPFPPSSDDSAPSEPMDDDKPKPSEDSESEDKPKEDKGEDKGEKVSLESLMKVVEQIATAVGVSPDGGHDKETPPDAPLADGPHPMPPAESIPPHDETTDMGAGTKQIIHRKAPPGATPLGSPAFASTKQAAPKVASFDVEEVVPSDFTIRQAKDEIESVYGEYGYKVKKIVEAKNESGERVIRAKVSVR